MTDTPSRRPGLREELAEAQAEVERLRADIAGCRAQQWPQRLGRAERERDEARQHAAAIAAQRDRLRQRMNTLADRWENALAVDKPYARTLRAEISCAPFDPEGAMAVQEYTERGRTLWAFRCWGTDTCDGWLGLGHHTQTSAKLEQERHVAEAHAEPGPECPDPQAESAIARVRAACDQLERAVVTADGRLLTAYDRGVDTAICRIRTALDKQGSPAAAEATDRTTQLAAAFTDCLAEFQALRAEDGSLLHYQVPKVHQPQYERWQNALQAAGQATAGAHVYLSTGCLHGDHDYCKSMTGLNGAKRPGECKKCAAKCICGCHGEPNPT